MSQGLTQYPAAKASGVPWLGMIPTTWAVRRSKRLFIPRTELARPDDVQLSATQAYGVIPQADFERAVGRKVVRVVQHLEKRRHVERDDFVISMRSFQGGLERAWASGCIRSSYVVLRSVADVDVDYYAFLFKTSAYIKELQSTANFIRDGQDLNFANFCAVDLPYPPLADQKAIARVLNSADRRIRRYIRAKQNLIALLEEQKQAIIHRAVTRGLDPGVRLKPSGVPWLGDVPEHWDVARFKRRLGFQEGPGIMAADFRDEGVPLLRISCLRGAVASLEGCNFLDAAMVRRRWSHFAVRGGDYLLSASASMGSVVFAPEAVAGAIPYTGILRLWPLSGEVFMPFVRLYMGCGPFQAQIDAAMTSPHVQ